MNLFIKLYIYFTLHIYSINRNMSSDNSSIRQIYQIPQYCHQQYAKGDHIKVKPKNKVFKKEDFCSVSRKAKNVKNFIQILKQKIRPNQHLSLDAPNEKQVQFLEQRHSKNINKAYLRHDNSLLFGFQFAIMLVLIIFIWKSSFEIIFGDLGEFEIINILTLFFYCIKTFLFLISEYKNQNLIIKNRSQIWDLYFTKKFAFDLVIFFSILLQLTPLDNYNQNYWFYFLTRLLSLLICKQYEQIQFKVENFLSTSSESESMVEIVKLMFKVFLFLHMLSIILNLLYLFEEQRGMHDNWINNSSFQDYTGFEKYIVGWYWGATILSTVGFGEIVPANNFERFFISIVQVTCCMLFGYFVNVIGALIKVRTESSEIFQKQNRSLNRYLNTLQVSNPLKENIRSQYANLHISEAIHNPQHEKAILDKLTPFWKTLLFEENNIKILKKCPVLQEFSHQTLMKLTQFLRKIVFAPENILYRKNHKVERKLWFIERGKIVQSTDNCENDELNKQIAVYDENERVVGWLNFLNMQPYKTMTKATTITIAYEVSETDFMNIIKENKKDYFKFLQKRHRIVEKNKNFISKCLSCDLYDHNIINCPRIHFNKNNPKNLIDKLEKVSNFKLNNNKKKYRLKRSSRRKNWKMNFTPQDRDKYIRLSSFSKEDIKNENDVVIENLLKDIVCQTSVNNRDKRRASNINNGLQNNSILAIIGSRLSDIDNKEKEKEKEKEKQNVLSQNRQSEEEQVTCIYFDQIFLSDEHKDYMPESDACNVIKKYDIFNGKQKRKEPRKLRFKREK